MLIAPAATHTASLADFSKWSRLGSVVGEVGSFARVEEFRVSALSETRSLIS